MSQNFRGDEALVCSSIKKCYLRRELEKLVGIVVIQFVV